MQVIVNSLRGDAESRLQPFEKFDIVSVKTQVVAGLNYLFKVSVGNAKHALIKVRSFINFQC